MFRFAFVSIRRRQIQFFWNIFKILAKIASFWRSNLYADISIDHQIRPPFICNGEKVAMKYAWSRAYVYADGQPKLIASPAATLWVCLCFNLCRGTFVTANRAPLTSNDSLADICGFRTDANYIGRARFIFIVRPKPTEVNIKLDSFTSSNHYALFSMLSMLVRVPEVFKNISLFPFNGMMRTISGATVMGNAGDSHCVDGTFLLALF